MHECMYISVYMYMYVDVHAYMCVRLANDSVNVKRKQISRFVVSKIPTFLPRGQVEFYRGYKFKMNFHQVECKSSSGQGADRGGSRPSAKGRPNYVTNSSVACILIL